MKVSLVRILLLATTKTFFSFILAVRSSEASMAGKFEPGREIHPKNMLTLEGNKRKVRWQGNQIIHASLLIILFYFYPPDI